MLSLILLISGREYLDLDQFKVGKDKWVYQTWFEEYRGERTELFLRNGVPVLINRDDYELAAGKLLKTPHKFAVFAARQHTNNGHGQLTTYYGIKGKAVHKLLSVHDEVGGPIIKDIDRDGVPEWTFDDYDHYTYYGDPPKWHLTYKLKGDKLVLWRKVPNHKKIRLRDNVRLFW